MSMPVRPGISSAAWIAAARWESAKAFTRPAGAAVRITHAPAKGHRLRADKGINLPDSNLRLPALTGKDRDDLRFVAAHAVECGFERLAEVQEEILWNREAAHVPVTWATHVFDTLAKEGLPSRAEITDSAMGNRAACVMLNKGRT